MSVCPFQGSANPSGNQKVKLAIGIGNAGGDARSTTGGGAADRLRPRPWSGRARGSAAEPSAPAPTGFACGSRPFGGRASAALFPLAACARRAFFATVVAAALTFARASGGPIRRTRYWFGPAYVNRTPLKSMAVAPALRDSTSAPASSFPGTPRVGQGALLVPGPRFEIADIPGWTSSPRLRTPAGRGRPSGLICHDDTLDPDAA